MTKLPLIAFATIVAAAGLAMPALAATSTSAGGVPYCASGTDSTLDLQKDELASQLRLDTKPGSVINVWNGCLKVITTENGMTTTAFYDPDTFKIVAEI